MHKVKLIWKMGMLEVRKWRFYLEIGSGPVLVLV